MFDKIRVFFGDEASSIDEIDGVNVVFSYCSDIGWAAHDSFSAVSVACILTLLCFF